MTRSIISTFFSPLLILGIGLTLLYYSGPAFLNEYNLSKTGIETQGKVVELRKIKTIDHTTYAPRIEFTDSKNIPVTFVSGNSSQPPEYNVGEVVTVIYDTENPGGARIKGSGMIMEIIFVTIAIFVTILGFANLLYVLFRTRKQHSVALSQML
jgi:hypothetical protein